MKRVIRLTEGDLHSIIRNSVRRLIKEEGEKVDAYGNPIPRYGQGWGKDSSLMNRQGYNEDGTKGPWFSRSVAVATGVFLNDNGRWYVLANQRGNGTPDYRGYWNLPCGYLDYNEEAEDAAAREIYEETGIKLDRSQIKYFGHSTSPDENRQNVCFFFTAFIDGSPSDFPFSKDNMEENEVDGIQWIPLERCNEFMWAFGHGELIQKALVKFSNKINGGDEGFGDVYQMLDRAINGLENGEDTEYIISLLKRVRGSI